MIEFRAIHLVESGLFLFTHLVAFVQLNYGTSFGRQSPDLVCLLDQEALTYSQLRVWVFYFPLVNFVAVFHHPFPDILISYSSIMSKR